ncbi:MAG: glutamate--tRNA ligase [Anaerolineae bacterium]|nr:glutamate--tRNA ligase [Anaerolineae bacterium]MCB9107177.1 glutamate--tRNA ligase [Anaerolineales bacterium]
MTMSTKPVRVRYAPSPTGDFHVGGARTALFNYLFARHNGGKFILRIEDTDQKRYNPEAVEWLLNGLRYLGLDWDEGPEVGGDYGPYVQTERLSIYRQYYQQLLDQGLAYRCFATPEELEEMRRERKPKGLPTYDRRYRDYDPNQAIARADSGESHVIRIKLPVDGSITVHDVIRGDITFQNDNLEDVIIVKSDGIPTYHLANVIDDHLMDISHVLRGDEWVSSMPLHIHLYNAFGWEPPVMAHLPVILNPTGRGKMSKRESRAPDGRVLPVFVRTFEELGYLSDAMVNYMALVGWSYDDKTEIMDREELIDRFSLDRVNASPASWNYDKLDYFNGVYLRALTPEALTDLVMPYLAKAGINADRATMVKIAPFIQERLNVLSDVSNWVDFFFIDELPPYDLNLLVPKKMSLADVPPILTAARDTLAKTEFNHDAIDAALRQSVKALGIKAGQMFQPIRIAVCGKLVAPPLFNTLEILGRETVLKRLDQAISRLEQN